MRKVLGFYVDMEDKLKPEELLELVITIVLDPKTFWKRSI